MASSSLALMGILGATGALGGAAISSNAANNAANTQAGAANNAANLEYQASQNALGFQEQQWNTEQQNLQPWLQGGQQGLSALEYGLGIGGNPSASSPSTSPYLPGGATPQPVSGTSAPTSTASGILTPTVAQRGQGNGTVPAGTMPAQATTQPGMAQNGPTSTAVPVASGAPSAPGAAAPQTSGGTTPAGATAAGVGYGSLMAPYSGGQFVAPTAAQALASPGEQAQLQLGDQALQQSAAARGGLLTGGTAEALDAYGQNLASTNYQNTYNQAFNTYAQNYNQYQNQQANQYNRLAALSGIGQTTAQDLGTLGQSASNNVSSNLLNTAAGMGQQYNNAAAANASGTVGAANAWSGALGGTTNNLSQLAMLQQLFGAGSGGLV